MRILDVCQNRVVSSSWARSGRSSAAARRQFRVRIGALPPSAGRDANTGGVADAGAWRSPPPPRSRSGGRAPRPGRGAPDPCRPRGSAAERRGTGPRPGPALRGSGPSRFRRTDGPPGPPWRTVPETVGVRARRGLAGDRAPGRKGGARPGPRRPEPHRPVITGATTGRGPPPAPPRPGGRPLRPSASRPLPPAGGAGGARPAPPRPGGLGAGGAGRPSSGLTRGGGVTRAGAAARGAGEGARSRGFLGVRPAARGPVPGRGAGREPFRAAGGDARGGHGHQASVGAPFVPASPATVRVGPHGLGTARGSRWGIVAGQGTPWQRSDRRWTARAGGAGQGGGGAAGGRGTPARRHRPVGRAARAAHGGAGGGRAGRSRGRQARVGQGVSRRRRRRGPAAPRRAPVGRGRDGASTRASGGVHRRPRAVRRRRPRMSASRHAHGPSVAATTGRPVLAAGRPAPAAAQSSAGPPGASPGRCSARNTCPPIRAVRLSAANQGHRPASIRSGLTK